MAPASSTVRTATSTAQRMQSRGHSPRTFLYGRTDVFRRPTPGGRGSPPLRWGGWVDWQRDCAAPTLHQPLSHGAKRRDSSPFRGAKGWARANRRFPSTNAGRAWKPAPTMGGLRWSTDDVIAAHPRNPSSHAGRAWKLSPAARKRTGPRTGPFFGMTQVLSITTPSTTSATFSQASAQSSRYL